MAVPFDLAQLPDLPCSPALRPSVHGATGDEKHDPIWKIYARRALSRSVLDSAAVRAASGLGLFCMASKATQSRRLCSTHSNIKKVPRREQLALIFFSFFPPAWDREPSVQLWRFLLVDIGLCEKNIYLFTCKHRIFSRWRVIFLYYCRLVFAGNASSCG